ncbi:HPF/RaiA family ribosome-associated protein [Massilia niabensis]|uniref:HPF/RaiA family ribosome-associated protein n=2 Tax=Massilia niabensis TaxID=544910 RepID=A0ABW0L9S8_9BURK
MTIHTNGFDITTALRSYIEQRLVTALGWARHHMRKLAVSLSDINGPRGGVDKRCKIQVRLAGGRDIIIDDIDADLYAAIDRAADRADRAVVKQVERTRHFAHTRLPGQLDAPDTTGADADDPQDRPSAPPVPR